MVYFNVICKEICGGDCGDHTFHIGREHISDHILKLGCHVCTRVMCCVTRQEMSLESQPREHAQLKCSI